MQPRPWLVSVILHFYLALQPGDLQASGDGPRVHGPAPIGVNVLMLNGLSLQDANRAFDPSLISPFAKFDTSILNIQYGRTSAIKGRVVTWVGILRGGQTQRRTLNPIVRNSSSGFADPFIGASINLAGLPPMTVQEFRQFEPRMVINFLIGASLPLGEYDSENVVNLGSNRWTLRFALPMVYTFSRFEGKKGTLELIPNLHVYTENRDKNLKQDPLFTLEGHATHDFSARSWGSLGILYTQGGKTSINGVTQNGSQKSLGLSASLGMEISPRWALRLRYGNSVAQNEFGLKGALYQFKLITRF